MATPTTLPTEYEGEGLPEASIDPPDTPSRSVQKRVKHRRSHARPAPAAPAPRNTDGTLTSASAREAVRARWATETDVQSDLEALFSTIEMAEGLALLERMRKNCELAARTIEKRRTEETLDTACYICETTKRQLGNRPWRMVTSFREVATGTWRTVYLCNDMCVIQWNKRKGIDGIPDRGVQASATDRSKSSIQAHQEKIAQDASLAKLGQEMAKQEKKSRR